MLAGTVNEYFYKVHVINYGNFIDSLNKLAESDLKKQIFKKRDLFLFASWQFSASSNSLHVILCAVALLC